MDWPAYLNEAVFSHIGGAIARFVGSEPSSPEDRFILAAVVFLGLLALRRPLRALILLAIGPIIGVADRKLRDEIVGALRQPVGLLPIAAGTFFALDLIRPEESAALSRIMDNIAGTLFIVTAYWTILSLAGPLTDYLVPNRGRMTQSVIDWIRKVAESFIVFFAIAAVLQQWGVKIGPLLAGMGIAGAAVALGAQTLFKNLISGALILLEERFQYGDWVKVDGVVEGIVESIGFRSTKIRQFDDAAVQVPNSDLADNAVVNYTRMRRRRIYWLVGVPYSTSVAQLKQIRDDVEAHIHGCDDFVPRHLASTFVRIDSFGESSINIMVYCFTRTTNWGEWLAVKERLAYRMMDIVLGAGSSFAFPSTSLYVESLPGDMPDLFLPPQDGKPQIAPAESGGTGAPGGPAPDAST